MVTMHDLRFVKTLITLNLHLINITDQQQQIVRQKGNFKAQLVSGVAWEINVRTDSRRRSDAITVGVAMGCMRGPRRYVST